MTFNEIKHGEFFKFLDNDDNGVYMKLRVSKGYGYIGISPDIYPTLITNVNIMETKKTNKREVVAVTEYTIKPAEYKVNFYRDKADLGYFFVNENKNESPLPVLFIGGDGAESEEYAGMFSEYGNFADYDENWESYEDPFESFGEPIKTPTTMMKRI